MASEAIKKSVAVYYADKLRTFGPTPKGVDWNGAPSQELRFQELMRIIEHKSVFSILDYGCGYGALFPLLQKHFQSFAYTGFDIAGEMLAIASQLHSGNPNWVSRISDAAPFDYVIASGIFNVQLNHTEPVWKNYILAELGRINGLAKQGFSFNALTTYSDPERMRCDLYYADPCFFFDYCKRSFSRNVALLHDYDLYEFTILVRK